MAKWLKDQKQTENSGVTQAQNEQSTRTVTPQPETTVQTQAASAGVSSQNSSQSGTALRKTDAGFIMSFSVPLRGGLFSTASAPL